MFCPGQRVCKNVFMHSLAIGETVYKHCMESLAEGKLVATPEKRGQQPGMREILSQKIAIICFLENFAAEHG
jgi:hypothetical protein